MHDSVRRAIVSRNERNLGSTMRSTTHWAAALLVFGLAITGFAEDVGVSDLCAVASVEGAQAGESGTPEALVVACAGSQQSASTTSGIGNQTHTVGDVGGESLNAVSTDIGNVAYTTGQVGDRTASTSTVGVQINLDGIVRSRS